MQRVRQILNTTRYKLRRYTERMLRYIGTNGNSLLTRFLNASYVRLRGLSNTFYVLPRMESQRLETDHKLAAPVTKRFSLNPFEAKPRHGEIYTDATFSRSLRKSYSRSDSRCTIVFGAYRCTGAFVVRLGSYLRFLRIEERTEQLARLPILSFARKHVFSIPIKYRNTGKDFETLSPVCVRVDYFEKSLR